MTAIMEVTYDKSVFVASEIEMVDKAIQNGHYDHLAAIIVEVTPEKAEEIAKIQRQMRPKSFTFDSQKQQEAEKWMAANLNDLTPEKEAEFQKLIDEEKQERLKILTGGLIDGEVENVEGSNTNLVTLTSNLHGVKGLGDKSIKRLNDAGVFSVDELRTKTHEERVKILGPLVAATLKTLI